MDRVTIALERRRGSVEPTKPALVLTAALHASILVAIFAAKLLSPAPPRMPVAIPIRIVGGGAPPPVLQPPPAPKAAPVTPSYVPPAPANEVPRQKLEPPKPKPPDPAIPKLADPMPAPPKPKEGILHQGPRAATQTPPRTAATAAPPPRSAATAAKPSTVPPAGAIAPGAGPGFGFSSDGAALDEADFQFPLYIQQMLGAISRNWFRPQGGETAGCIVWFRISRQGAILESRLESPSGLSHFDRSALRAVQNAAPFPPLPADFPGPHLGVHLRFQ